MSDTKIGTYAQELAWWVKAVEVHVTNHTEVADVVMDLDEKEKQILIGNSIKDLQIDLPLEKYLRFTVHREDHPEFKASIVNAFSVSNHAAYLADRYCIMPPSFSALERKKVFNLEHMLDAAEGHGPFPSVPDDMWECVIPDTKNAMLVHIPLDKYGYFLLVMITHPKTIAILKTLHRALLTDVDELGMSKDNVNYMGSVHPTSVTFARVLVASARHINSQYAILERKLADDLMQEQQQEELQKQAAMTAMQLVGAIQSKSGKYDAMIAQLTHTTNILAKTGSGMTGPTENLQMDMSLTGAHYKQQQQREKVELHESQKKYEDLQKIAASQFAMIQDLQAQVAHSDKNHNVMPPKKTPVRQGMTPEIPYDATAPSDEDQIARRKARIAAARAL